MTRMRPPPAREPAPYDTVPDRLVAGRKVSENKIRLDKKKVTLYEWVTAYTQHITVRERRNIWSMLMYVVLCSTAASILSGIDCDTDKPFRCAFGLSPRGQAAPLGPPAVAGIRAGPHGQPRPGPQGPLGIPINPTAVTLCIVRVLSASLRSTMLSRKLLYRGRLRDCITVFL